MLKITQWLWYRQDGTCTRQDGTGADGARMSRLLKHRLLKGCLLLIGIRVAELRGVEFRCDYGTINWTMLP